MKAAVVGCLLTLSVLPVTSSQDPPAKNTDLPAPPQDKKARKLPPVLEPLRSRIERRDLLQQFRTRHRIEGIYRLKRMVSPGAATVKGSRGYLVIGQRHMSMHLYAPGDSEGEANIQAVFRRYRIVGDQLIMNTLLGHRNKDNGDIGFEPISYVTRHRFVLTGASLRLYRAKDQFLEFERIE
jgi:hypothetical protein